MRPSLVNGLAFTAAVFFISAGCSTASGHNDKAAASGAEAEAGATPASVAATSSGGAAAPISDSLAKLADASRILGSPSAKLWVIEVSDFQCPYCKQWHDNAYAMLINDYVRTGKVRLAYVNYPLSMHQNARAAATTAMCAGTQGKFWQMHDALFASQNGWESLQNPSAAFDSLAKAVGLDLNSYHSCLGSPSIAALINGDQDRAQRGGVSSTPSFWVGSRLIEGAVPATEMRAALDQALASQKPVAGSAPTGSAPTGSAPTGSATAGAAAATTTSSPPS